MNTKAVCIFASVAALVFGTVHAAPASETAPAKRYGVDREELRAVLVGYELPPASELARDITREIVGTQRDDAHLRMRADFRASRSDSLPSEATGRPSVRAVGAGQSERHTRGEDSAGPLAWLRAGLRKLAGLMPPRK